MVTPASTTRSSVGSIAIDQYLRTHGRRSASTYKEGEHNRVLRTDQINTVLCHDVSVAVLAFHLAFLLCNGIDLDEDSIRAFQYSTPAFVLLAGVSFYTTGLHRRVWSYTSVADLALIAKASTWAVLLLLLRFLVRSFLRRAPLGPNHPVVHPSGVVERVTARIPGHQARQPAGTARPRPARQCAGPGLRLRTISTSLFLRAVQSVPRSDVRVVGIIDEVGDRCGRYLNNTPVLGQARDLERVLIDLAVQGVHPAKLIALRPPDEVTEEAQAAMEFARLHHGLLIDYLPAVFGLRRALPRSESCAGMPVKLTSGFAA